MRHGFDVECDASGTACVNFVDLRGWSMKRGHGKRLLKPKRGKAAIRAEIQGQGKEVLRGRSAFSRTIGHRGRRCSSPDWRGKYGLDYPIHRRRNKLRKIVIADAREYHADQYWKNFIEDDEWYSVQEFNAADKEDLESQKEFLGPLDFLCHHLQAKHQAVVEVEPLTSDQPFAQLQKGFLLKHGGKLCRALREQCYCGRSPLTIKPTLLSAEVQQRFLEANSSLPGTLRPAFHGTSSTNFASIFRRGLLIPGQDNELRVVNGAVHGQGIYTANIEHPDLSWSFCDRQKKMLICGVLDDANSCPKYRLGQLTVSAQSASVLHVGRAMVISDDRRVAPLFEVAYTEVPCSYTPRPTPCFDWARHWRVLERVLGDLASVRGDIRGRLLFEPGRKPKLNKPSKRNRSNGHDADLCRRRLLAKEGHSIPLCPRKKAWKMLVIKEHRSDKA